MEVCFFSQTQKEVTLVYANLARQKVDSRIPASDYLEVNQDLLDILMAGSVTIRLPFLHLDCVSKLFPSALSYQLLIIHRSDFSSYLSDSYL